MSTTAIPMSALGAGRQAFPAPTLSDGLPAAFAAATAFGPPVVQIRSIPSWWKRYWETSRVGSGITWSASGGSPSRLAGLLEDLDRPAAQRAARAEGGR